MSEPLHLKYRPATFEDMVGQRRNAVVLEQMVATGQVPQGLMFSGVSGAGKTSAARILASAMGATDVIEVDAASNGGVNEIRKILDAARYSTGGPARVVIIDEAHSVTRQGFEALLKTLEEPTPGTHFVLVTTEPWQVPKTIQGRVIEFQFRSIAPGDIAKRLALIATKEGIRVTRDLLLHLAGEAEGDLRTAVQSLDKVARGGIETLPDYLELVGDADPAPTLFAALATGDHAKIFAVLDEQLATVGSPGQITAQLIALIRDLFILKAGGELSAGGNGAELRAQMARRVDQERLFVAVRILWDVRTKLRAVEDPKGSLELALVLIAEAFNRGTGTRNVPAVVHSEKPPQEEPRRLTLAEMQKR